MVDDDDYYYYDISRLNARRLNSVTRQTKMVCRYQGQYRIFQLSMNVIIRQGAMPDKQSHIGAFLNDGRIVQ